MIDIFVQIFIGGVAAAYVALCAFAIFRRDPYIDDPDEFVDY